MSTKSRIALISCLCGGCYVGFYNPKQIDTDLRAFWHVTSTLKTGSVRLGLSIKPQPAARAEVRTKTGRQNPTLVEQEFQTAGKMLDTSYKAAKRATLKTKTPRS